MSNRFNSHDINGIDYIQFLNEFEEEIRNNSDRGIALICGSIIDRLLTDVLKSLLIESDQVDKELFRDKGPLADFEAKMKMAFYLGLISENEFSNIKYIQRVWNRFAHEIQGISFEAKHIQDICSNFYIPKNSYTPENISLLGEADEEIPVIDLNPIKTDTSAKDRFIFTFRYLFMNLVNRAIIEDIDKRTEYISIPWADKSVELGLNKMKSMLQEQENDLEKNRHLYSQQVYEDKLNELAQTRSYLTPLIEFMQHAYDMLRQSLKEWCSSECISNFLNLNWLLSGVLVYFK